MQNTPVIIMRLLNLHHQLQQPTTVQLESHAKYSCKHYEIVKKKSVFFMCVYSSCCSFECEQRNVWYCLLWCACGICITMPVISATRQRIKDSWILINIMCVYNSCCFEYEKWNVWYFSLWCACGICITMTNFSDKTMNEGLLNLD